MVTSARPSAAARLRLGLVGCGAVAEQLHWPAIQARDDVLITAAIDRNSARARLLAKMTGARACTEIAEALPHIDAAIVALPHFLHAPASIELLRAGKPVLVEKPMAITPAECAAMIAAAKTPGASLTAGQMRRFCPAVEAAKALLAGSILGTVRRFEMFEGDVYDWPVASGFFFDRATAGGGVLIDTGAHTFDMILWLLGQAAEISYRDDAHGGVEADCAVELRMESGATGYVELSRTRNLPTEFVVIGDNGQLRLDYRLNRLTLRLGDAAPGEFQFPTAHQSFPQLHVWQLMIVRQLDDWVAALRAGRAGRVDGEEGAKVVDLIARCYDARQPLDLPWAKRVQPAPKP